MPALRTQSRGGADSQQPAGYGISAIASTLRLFPLGPSPAVPGGPHKFPSVQFPLASTKVRGRSGKC
eukprot:353513-Chlamydomonas_euryale.AAC.4